MLIYKWVPIIGPVLGSAFVIGLYIAARLLKGDLTDRMKLMDEGEEKRKRTALKEARIAFLEEEVPALVARNTELATIKYVLDGAYTSLLGCYVISPLASQLVLLLLLPAIGVSAAHVLAGAMD